MSYVEKLTKKGLIKPPKFVVSDIQYEAIVGSFSYGVTSDTSDIDLYGFCIPQRDTIFPHLKGEILGFGRQTQRFEQYQQHHIIDKDADKEYDITIYNIIKFFQLCMDNNPNIIDALFVPQRCIVECTQVGDIVRENRKLFLHKGSWFKFKGYSFSQINKIKTKVPEGKRKEGVDKYGYDLKFSYHAVRLLNEIEQIMTEGDLDLERNREQLKAIRRGDWTKEQVFDYFDQKERELESLYTKSTLPHSPNEEAIKKVLLTCLEHHFGSLDKMVKIQGTYENLLKDMQKVLDKYSKPC